MCDALEVCTIERYVTT